MTYHKKGQEINSTEGGMSPLEQAVRELPIEVCPVFLKDHNFVPASFEELEETISTKDSEKVSQHFKNSTEAHGNKILVAKTHQNKPVTGKRVAVLFSGGPAAGGHNVIVGLKKILGDDNTLLGVKAGPKGLLEGNLMEVTTDQIKFILNTGGFDFIGSDRTKIKSDDQFAQVKKVCQDNDIDAIVIIGGDDSNTNAGILAEKLFKDVHPDGRGVQVIGVPKTIDGDLQIGDKLPISFGFHTATRIYAELVGNILQDTPSSRKYWHFVKLMGRSASHVTLEVALQTKPAITLISEEIAAKNISLHDIIDQIANVVINRSRRGLNHGVVLIPEGIIEFIPEMTSLIEDLNEHISAAMSTDYYKSLVENKDHYQKREYIFSKLSDEHTALMKSLPDYIQDMLLADRDAHGNLQVSLIPTEKLLIDMVTKRIPEIDNSVPFSTHSHFFGYEGRCGMPTKFDMTYCLNLGMAAASLILDGRTGYLASISSFNDGGDVYALPLTGLFNIERRHGQDEMVIEKALVELDSPAFQYFESRRDEWANNDKFSSPGPRQLWGPVANGIPKTVYLNQKDYYMRTFYFGEDISIFPDKLKMTVKKIIKGTGLEFHEFEHIVSDNDDVYQITLKKNVTIKGTKYHRDSIIAINEEGDILVIGD